MEIDKLFAQMHQRVHYLYHRNEGWERIQVILSEKECT